MDGGAYRVRCVSRELFEEGIDGVDGALDALLLLQARVPHGAAILGPQTT